MFARFRWLYLTALLAAFGAMIPSQADASISCTKGYQTCLNDSWETTGVFRVMADLECAARYARCIKDILVG